MSNNEHNRAASLTVEEEIAISVEPQIARDAGEKAGMLGRLRHSLREHPGKSLAGVLALLAVLIVAAYFLRNLFLYEDTDDAQVDGHVMPLSARIGGQIKGVHIIEGQLVHANDVLVT